MTTWGTIRKCTAQDYVALEKMAKRFANRHDFIQEILANNGITIKNGHLISWFREVETYIKLKDDPHLLRLWKAGIRRALGESDADGIAYGSVGYYVN